MNGRAVIPARRIRPGATIGIFSPSEPIVDSRIERFRKGLSILAEHGFRSKLGKNCLAVSAYSAGSVHDRLDDIHGLVRDPEVDALLASWGGKSCNQLIRHLRYEEIAKARKAIMGFSDVSVLLNAITAVTGLITFHGPNVVGKLDETKHAGLDLLLSGNAGNPANLLEETPSGSARVIHGGKATGRLFGGNLSTFVLGVACASFLKNYWDGGIFFWEEMSLPSQLIDQHLSALKNLGLLDGISGMVIGSFVSEDPIEWKRMDSFSTLRAVLSECRYPVLYCPTFGHAPVENPILPIGGLCSLDADEMRLQLVEPAVE